VERPTGAMPVHRVRKAYEQVADQLRELIVGGELSSGERLPNENTLAREFGVSRATVREALRLLAAQNLIRTAKGAGGGSYVTLPSVDHISEFLHASINLLTEAQDVSLEEFLEARELLEVPAARLAAQRRSEGDFELLRAAIPSEPLKLGTQEQFVYNKEFHSVIIAACGNTLLAIAAQPVFTVLQTNLVRSTLGRRFHRAINEHHRAIIAAIAEGDADAAGGEMLSHLQFLRPFYEKAWRHAVRARARA
jgi:GntR family transcriptional regulator, transcriptional repressor for pyruvate dehydrogenase complex